MFQIAVYMVVTMFQVSKPISLVSDCCLHGCHYVSSKPISLVSDCCLHGCHYVSGQQAYQSCFRLLFTWLSLCFRSASLSVLFQIAVYMVVTMFQVSKPISLVSDCCLHGCHYVSGQQAYSCLDDVYMVVIMLQVSEPTAILMMFIWLSLCFRAASLLLFRWCLHGCPYVFRSARLLLFKWCLHDSST